MPNPTDIDLLRQARAGKQDAFHALIDRHAPALFRLAPSLVPTHQDAEDLLQETFTAAFRSLNSFQERSSVKTWLYAILFRQAAMLRRKIGVPLRSLTEEIPSPLANQSLRTDARLDLEQALDHLPEGFRTVLMLRELDGLSYSEIATLLNLPQGTIESRLNRARQALKSRLISKQNP
jgi:RNA polymerase sigma-70 factor, ECF subfamily